MTDDFDHNVAVAVRALYEQNEDAKELFDWTAGLERDASATSIDRIMQKLEISRRSAVALARALEEAGCGEFLNGRRGHKSRFAWAYSRISLGKAAAGESDEIEQVSDPIPEEEDRDDAQDRATILTIPEAKVRLARGLGIDPDKVEILIRA
ncbi:hypothetical protein LAZ40_11145 [Cereibacter sphaeroides]|uniref:hypothetical protein n=1 Tax=Cereibacter sphaeroides TaxID=1063 RepID=UPI001F36BDCE|nr:hypothetical protein [Cereibacter sphaeroides]MCE6959611.1 hypothetical protein [Cereibacter sphaeroides]MCE6974529.1 hypothetical protein [Cereibacter sphaeroides]